MNHDKTRPDQLDPEEKQFLECEKRYTFWVLIFVAGFYGAYTVLLRGGVFCNAQTANVVLFSVAIGQHDFKKALYLIIPISSYFFGAVVSEILAKRVKKFRLLRWDTYLVGFEILMVIFLGALPASAPDQICQVFLNFTCSMQFNTYRQNEGIPMATTFVTNHIRQFGSNIVKAYRDHDPKARRRYKMHVTMIVMFSCGGVLSAVLCTAVGLRAIWFAGIFLLILFIRLAYADRVLEKGMMRRVPRGH